MSGQKIVIHQFHPTAAFGDAITQQMFLIRDSLAKAGIGGEIFAKERKGIPDVRPFSRADLWDADLLLVHHSSGHPACREARSLEVPKALVYHNITPPEFFRHDPFIAGLCRLGREQLVEWRPDVIAAFAVSRFNAAELESLGFPSPKFLPLLDLKAKSFPAGKTKRSRGQLLFVGRLSPHKNQAALISALFYLNKMSDQPYRLILAGSGDPLYGDYLKLLAKQLGVEKEVELLGKVSRQELGELYRRADAYVSASLHEGFGVPLVEAMRAELPVFALPKAAIAETLGSAGIRIPSERPSEMAVFLNAILGASDWEETRAKLIDGQNSRLAELSKEQSPALIPVRLKALVEDLRRGPGPRPASKRRTEAVPHV